MFSKQRHAVENIGMGPYTAPTHTLHTHRTHARAHAPPARAHHAAYASLYAFYLPTPRAPTRSYDRGLRCRCGRRRRRRWLAHRARRVTRDFSTGTARAHAHAATRNSWNARSSCAETMGLRVWRTYALHARSRSRRAARITRRRINIFAMSYLHGM